MHGKTFLLQVCNTAIASCMYRNRNAVREALEKVRGERLSLIFLHAVHLYILTL